MKSRRIWLRRPTWLLNSKRRPSRSRSVMKSKKIFLKKSKKSFMMKSKRWRHKWIKKFKHRLITCNKRIKKSSRKKRINLRKSTMILLKKRCKSSLNVAQSTLWNKKELWTNQWSKLSWKKKLLLPRKLNSTSRKKRKNLRDKSCCSTKRNRKH